VISDNSRVTRKAGVLLTRAGDEAVLVDDAGGNVHVLNRTGAQLWELSANEPTVDALAESIAGSYAADPATVRADVERMLTELCDLGLVELVAAG